MWTAKGPPLWRLAIRRAIHHVPATPLPRVLADHLEAGTFQRFPRRRARRLLFHVLQLGRLHYYYGGVLQYLDRQIACWLCRVACMYLRKSQPQQLAVGKWDSVRGIRAEETRFGLENRKYEKSPRLPRCHSPPPLTLATAPQTIKTQHVAPTSTALRAAIALAISWIQGRGEEKGDKGRRKSNAVRQETEQVRDRRGEAVH